MHLFEALFLGLIQGLTEFLPISSSAHIRVIGELLPMGSEPGAAFTAIIQIGTEAAVLLYFRREIAGIIKAWIASLKTRGQPLNDQARMGWLIIIGSIPIVVLGLAFQDTIETRFRNLWLVATTLAVFAALLYLADRYTAKRRHRTKQLNDLTWTDGLIYGGAQALALIPGVSRSGATITAGLFMGYSRAAAAKYSFLLAMPAVFGSGFYQAAKSLGQIKADPLFPGWAPTIVAALIAFVVGYLVIIAFLKIISTFSYRPFVYYRLGLSALIMGLLASGLLTTQ
ncbi:MAG: undecaprenyl-diphosphate phosphatase [Micrococcales bacterium]|nr:undecaprenyl-diphosphate phosphatase [Micrococcales bacterium]